MKRFKGCYVLQDNGYSFMKGGKVEGGKSKLVIYVCKLSKDY
jgi:hypothetical protein